MSPPQGAAAAREGDPLAALYRAHFHDCCRWLRALGTPATDVEDLAQEVFVVAHRKLPAQALDNPRGWLYQVALRTVSDHRRRAWWKNLWSRRAALPADRPASEPGPAEALDRAERARLCDRLLDRLSPTHRATLVLHEVEGYRGEEIAALQGVPLGTVWTRLHHARRQFFALCVAERARLRGEEEVGS